MFVFRFVPRIPGPFSRLTIVLGHSYPWGTDLRSAILLYIGRREAVSRPGERRPQGKDCAADPEEVGWRVTARESRFYPRDLHDKVTTVQLLLLLIILLLILYGPDIRAGATYNNHKARRNARAKTRLRPSMNLCRAQPTECAAVPW